jgi:voltage-gated potassium channel
VLIAAGTIAFALAEGTSIGYGFVWTLDTVTTLGAIQDPHNTAGRVVVVALELLGIGTLFYGLATVAEFFVSGQLTGLLEERRLQRMIDSYSDHYIICGFGRVGRQVARDLRAAGRPHVAIDHNPEHREQARELGVQYIENYAAEDEVLLRAGIERARGVIACVDSDAENIFITLTARGLRPDVLIIARASAEDSETKLRRAGADRVISPYKTSGAEMARVALHPQVGGAVQVADYRMEEIEVSAPCEGIGKTVEQVRGDSVIVALRRTDGRLEPQPAPQAVIDEGDMVVAIGTPASLERLEGVFQPIALGNP